MKGVIVQVGEPKSIVLFNNGKTSAVPTPPDCRIGMVVTVKYNSTLKIAVIVLAAVLLVAAGVCVGVSAVKNTAPDSVPGWQRGAEKQREIEKKFLEK